MTDDGGRSRASASISEDALGQARQPPKPQPATTAEGCGSKGATFSANISTISRATGGAGELVPTTNGVTTAIAGRTAPLEPGQGVEAYMEPAFAASTASFTDLCNTWALIKESERSENKEQRPKVKKKGSTTYREECFRVATLGATAGDAGWMLEATPSSRTLSEVVPPPCDDQPTSEASGPEDVMLPVLLLPRYARGRRPPCDALMAPHTQRGRGPVPPPAVGCGAGLGIAMVGQATHYRWNVRSPGACGRTGWKLPGFG